MNPRIKLIITPILMITLAFSFRFAGGQADIAAPVYAASSDGPLSPFAVYDNQIPAPRRVVLPSKDITPRGEVVLETLSVPDIDTDFKAYMDYRTITDKAAPQWRYRELAYTDDYGFRRIVNDYVVALGTYYSEAVGERFLVTLESGKSFTVITGDIKDPAHTDPKNMYTPVYYNGGKVKSGCVIEFLVDTKKLDKTAVALGTVSYYDTFEGNIKKIEKL
jgi:hypothetical protein